MPDFRCWNYDCAYEKNNQCTCEESFVNISEEFYYGCDNFLDYTETQEFRHPYYRSLKDKESGKLYRKLFHGKQIIINDEVFFTEEKYLNANTWVTHQRTGTGSHYKMLIEKWDLFKQREADCSDVLTLPTYSELGYDD